VDIHKGDRENHKEDRSTKELIPKVNLTDTLNDQGDIILHKLLDKLKHQYNMPIESN
jgi:hypothetical protein